MADPLRMVFVTTSDVNGLFAGSYVFKFVLTGSTASALGWVWATVRCPGVA